MNFLLLAVILFHVHLIAQPKNSSAFSIQKVINYYKNHKPVKMNLKKTTHLALLKKDRTFYGKIILAPDFLELKISQPLRSRLLLTQKFLWHVTCPINGKGVSHVVKYPSPLSSTSHSLVNAKNSNLILVLFEPDHFSKLFRFVSSHIKGRTRINRFQPTHSNLMVKSLLLKTEKSVILKAFVQWKDSNYEEYEFSNIRFNQSLSKVVIQSAQSADKKLTCLKEVDRVNF